MTKKLPKIIGALFLFAMFTLFLSLETQKKYSVEKYRNTYTNQYVSKTGVINPVGTQSSIEYKNRVPNYTGIQCVYSSIETLGRHAGEIKLIDPPITSRSNCKSYSDPYRAGKILTDLGVKFKQEYNDRSLSLDLLKKSLSEGRGCTFSIPGHVMVAVHYSEEEDRFCWIDNSDRSLKVQQTSIANFHKMWNGWVLVIYTDNDLFHFRERIKNIPIIDRLNLNYEIPKDYVPFPKNNDYN